MPERIFQEEPIEVFKECIIKASDRHGFPLTEHLRDAGLIAAGVNLSDPHLARVHMDGILKALNWTDSDNVKPIVSILEGAYAESPKGWGSIHREVDVHLARGGYRIKDGQMMRLL